MLKLIAHDIVDIGPVFAQFEDEAPSRSRVCWRTTRLLARGLISQCLTTSLYRRHLPCNLTRFKVWNPLSLRAVRARMDARTDAALRAALGPRRHPGGADDPLCRQDICASRRADADRDCTALRQRRRKLERK